MRRCKVCNELLKGRSDQKFCSDYCRVHYHNNRYQSERRLFGHINKILRKNWTILKAIPSEPPHNAVSIASLEALGFKHGYVTKTTSDTNGQTMYWIYDVAFTKMFEKQIVISNVNDTAKNI